MMMGPRTLLKGAVGCAVVFLLLLGVIYSSWQARWLDATAWRGFMDLQGPLFNDVTWRLAELGDPEQVGLFGVALAALALARGKPRHAAAVIFLLAVTSVSSQALKAIFDYPRYESLLVGPDVKPAAFPSGHATAAMTLALCGVLVLPQRARLLGAALGTAFALAVSFSVVSLGWHFPSDVAGGFLLASFWTLVALAALRTASVRWPAKPRRSYADTIAQAGTIGLAAAAALVTAMVAAVVIVYRLDDVTTFIADHTWSAVIAGALAATAAAVLALFASLLARRR